MDFCGLSLPKRTRNKIESRESPVRRTTELNSTFDFQTRKIVIKRKKKRGLELMIKSF